MAKFVVNYKPDTYVVVHDANIVWLPESGPHADGNTFGMIADGYPIFIELDGAIELIVNETTGDTVYTDGRPYKPTPLRWSGT